MTPQTERALDEVVEQVSRFPFVREIAATQRPDLTTVWTVIDTWTYERARAVLGAGVAVLVATPHARLDLRILNAKGAGETGVCELLTSSGMVTLWSRSRAKSA